MVAFAGTAQEKVIRSPVVSTEKLEYVENFPDFQRKTNTEKTSVYSYIVSTIMTTSEPINQYVQMWIEKEINQFIHDVEKNNPNDTEQHPAQLHISVEIYGVTDEIYSLIFTVKNKETNRQDVMKIFNLDLLNHKILSLTDIFNLDHANVEGFRSIVKEQMSVQDENSLKEWLEKSLKQPNQLNWQIDQTSFHLLSDAPENHILVEIPVEKLSPYLTNDIMNRLQIHFTDDPANSLHPDGKYIALTFDDGPSPSVTPQILETLKQYSAKATFFMVGSRVLSYPELALQVAGEGHEIGNHTGNHSNLSKLSEEQIRQEIIGSSQVIESIIGESPTFFRPPYGVYNPSVEKVALEHNSPIILWSVDSLDWKNRKAENVHQLVKENIAPGAIVLLHDIHQSTADALPILMAELSNEGYQFVTVSELLSLQGISGIGPYYGVSY